jgi:hypothetical protein
MLEMLAGWLFAEMRTALADGKKNEELHTSSRNTHPSGVLLRLKVAR